MCMFSSPKMPPRPAPPPEPPRQATPAQSERGAQARSRQERRLRATRGYGATILTGSDGLGEAADTAERSLLGASGPQRAVPSRRVPAKSLLGQ